MRRYLVVAGLVVGVSVSLALAGGDGASPARPELKDQVDDLAKKVAELEKELRDLKLQMAAGLAEPVTTAVPSNISRGAIPREINGGTFYVIPLGGKPKPE